MYYKDPHQVYVRGQDCPALSEFYFDPKVNTVVFEGFSFAPTYPIAGVYCSRPLRENLGALRSIVVGPSTWRGSWGWFGFARKPHPDKALASTESCVKPLTEMFEKIRGQLSGQGGVEVSALMKCHKPGARTFIGRQVVLQTGSSQRFGGGTVVFRSKADPPAVLHATTESRNIGLKEYKIILRDFWNQDSLVYVNPEVDNVFFQYSTIYLDNYLDINSKHMRAILNKLTAVEMNRLWWEEAFSMEARPSYLTSTLPTTIDSADVKLRIKTAVEDKFRQYFKKVPGYEVPAINFRVLKYSGVSRWSFSDSWDMEMLLGHFSRVWRAGI
ncbi:hypothetical protein IFR05_003953 [Cadophora sp. M221]|nr:hypothetical protein IFR05_003953 [Cadophora sp. M221]